MTEWHFTILGRPEVKKNSRTLVRMGKRCPKCKKGTGQLRSRPSPQYDAWEKDAVLQLRAQWRGCDPLDLPVNAAIVTYQAKSQHCDASNLYEGAQDALQKAGVLRNDYLIESHDGSRRRRDWDNPRVEITLTAVGKNHAVERPETRPAHRMSKADALALGVKCPDCGAGPNKPCVGVHEVKSAGPPYRGDALDFTHLSRQKKARRDDC